MAEVWAAAIGAGAAVYGTVSSAQAQKKAAAQANQAAQDAKIDVGAVSQQAQDQALKNIELSRTTEQKYDPQNAALRTNSVQALLSQLGQNPNSAALQQLIGSQLGQGVGAARYDAQTANSDLLNAAIAKAQENLALGGSVPLDVRNLVARTAASRTGQNFGNLGGARDITARDLGLTSLDLSNQRLGQAQSLGQAQLGANQFNAGQINNAGQFNANLLQNSNQFNANNTLNQAQLLQALSNGDFSKALAAAQFGQSLQAPVVGLDPSAIANLYVGNNNASTQAGLNAAQIAASQAQGTAQIAGGLLGSSVGALSNYYGNKPVVGTTPKSTYTPGYMTTPSGPAFGGS